MKKADIRKDAPSPSGGRKVDRVALLEKVAELGSITAAAKGVDISYKGAWEAIEALNKLSDPPLVERTVGGTGGGRRLTSHGGKVLSLLRDMDTDSRPSSPPWAAAEAVSTPSRTIFNSCGDGT